MSFNITDFSGKVKAGLQRQYMFKAEFYPPDTFGDNDLISALVETTSMPPKNVTPVEANFMGQQYKIAGNLEFPDWTVTFRIDGEYKIYNIMRSWVDGIRNPDTNALALPAIYKRPITLLKLKGDDLNTTVWTLKLFGAFPSSIGEVTLDTKTAELQSFQVTFAYDYNTWKLGKEDGI